MYTTEAGLFLGYVSPGPSLYQGWLSDIQSLGAPPTVGLVEGLLLLAENLPRDPRQSDPDLHAIGYGEQVHGAENRQTWMLIGTAIRSAYGLGLEKVGLILRRLTPARIETHLRVRTDLGSGTSKTCLDL
jgi:hypothetical protein